MSGNHRQFRMSPSQRLSMIWQLIDTLSQIDANHDFQLNEVERSATDEDLKELIKQKLRAVHRERREPYVKQLEELRQQQERQSFTIWRNRPKT